MIQMNPLGCGEASELIRECITITEATLLTAEAPMNTSHFVL